MSAIYDMRDIAARAGITYDGVAKAYTRSKAKVKGGEELTDSDLPLPERHVGQSPVWLEHTLAAWFEKRGV